METLIKRHLAYMQNISLDFVRDLMEGINWEDRLIAIRGQRGVGKTTLVLQRIAMQFGSTNTTDVLYVSLDNLYFYTHRLLDFIEQFHARGGNWLFIDEVHKYNGWSREIKNAYDEFADMHIVITGSSMIDILNSEVDLSRRCIAYDMQGLSFREYLAMQHGTKLEKYSIEEILKDGTAISQKINATTKPLKYFRDYLSYGYYPFVKEGRESYYIRIENIITMVIETELPALRKIDLGNVRKIKALIEVLASGLPLAIDTVKLSKMAEISRTSLLQYLQHLADAGILNLLYSDNTSVKRMQKPDKVYLENTNMLYALSSTQVNIGTAREVFFVNQLSYRHTVEYSNTQADFTINGKYTIEVDGRSKDGSQLPSSPNAFIAADDEEYAIGNKIPLWMFGLLY